MERTQGPAIDRHENARNEASIKSPATAKCANRTHCWEIWVNCIDYVRRAHRCGQQETDETKPAKSLLECIRSSGAASANPEIEGTNPAKPMPQRGIDERAPH